MNEKVDLDPRGRKTFKGFSPNSAVVYLKSKIVFTIHPHETISRFTSTYSRQRDG